MQEKDFPENVNTFKQKLFTALLWVSFGLVQVETRKRESHTTEKQVMFQ